MSRAEGQQTPYQLHLGEETPETIFRFDKGTMIYPFRSRRGFLQGSVFANPTNLKRWGLKVYKSLNRIDLWFAGSYWSLPEGSLFAAHSLKRHGVKIG